MQITSDIGEVAEVADDLVKEISTITNELMAEREPLRIFRIKNRLIDKIKAVCIQYIKVPVQRFVAAFASNLAPEEQQNITAIIQGELSQQSADTLTEEKQKAATGTNQVLSNQTIKSKKMGEAKDPNLNEDELSLTTALGKLGVLIAVFIGKGETFLEATLNGLKSLQPTTPVTMKQVIDQAFNVLITIAVIINFVPFIKLANIAKTLYDDIATGGKVNILQFFTALLRSRSNIKADIVQAKALQTDPTLGADELNLATQLGLLVQMIALYLASLPGAAAGKADSFINAFMEGITEVDQTQPVALKDVVDGAFNVVSILGSIINNNLVKLVITAVWNLYDDFAGGKTSAQALWTEISAAKTKIAAEISKPAPKAVATA